MHVVVLFGPSMRVQMPVWDAVVLVHMTMHPECAHERDHTETDEAQPDDAFDGWREFVRESPPCEHKRATDEKDDERVTDAPTRAYRERAPPLGSATHEYAHGGKVIWRQRMGGAEDQSGEEEQGRWGR
jgi:hypothetical protein